MTIYRGYDQAGLDAQYNCRAMVPETDALFARWRALSDQAKARFPATLDVAYGPGEAERLDIYRAEADAAPVVAFIHGGYWRGSDKSEHGFPALGFVPAGMHLVSVNYALAPAVRLAEIVRQCREAVAWVWRNAASFGGDPARLAVCGHSAGGHLTAMMAATDWPAVASDLPADLVKAAAPISGLYDLEPIRLTYLNADLRLDEPEVAGLSPVRLVPRGAAQGVIATVGGLESAEFHRQQAALAAAWRGHGRAIDAAEIPARHHFDVVLDVAEPDGRIVPSLARLLAGGTG